MMFHTFVYKSPGPHKCATNGKKSYDFVGVEDQKAFDELIAKGWFATAEDAMFPKEVEAPPTREEIEKMAKDLDIKFDGRTSDKKLLKQIDDKLEEDRGLD